MLKPAEGPLFYAVIVLLCFAGCYALWPPDLFSIPAAEMTLGTLVRLFVSLIMGFGGVEFLAALAIVLLSDN